MGVVSLRRTLVTADGIPHGNFEGRGKERSRGK